jgi:hypothetical protein
MTEISGELPQNPQTEEYPVKELAHSVDNWFNLFYRVGKATHRSKTAKGEGDSRKIERSLHGRVSRRDILGRLESGQISRLEAVAEGKKLDEIDRQFADQKELVVNLPELGQQSSFYTDINLSKNSESGDSEQKPPVFIVPALSGDLYGIEPIVRELALSGRRVVSVAYPESFHGETTKEFADAVDSSKTYYPHTDYFKKAIELLLQEGNIELWGFSTGGPIVAELLSDPEIQERTTNAVVVSPASCLNQSKIEFNAGLLNEMKETAKNIAGLSDISLVYGRKTSGDKDNLERRKRIFNTLLFQKVCKETEAWRDMRVKEHGEITIILGGKDKITKSYSKVKEFNALIPQVRVIEKPNWAHLTPLFQAKELVDSVSH